MHALRACIERCARVSRRRVPLLFKGQDFIHLGIAAIACFNPDVAHCVEFLSAMAKHALRRIGLPWARISRILYAAGQSSHFAPHPLSSNA